MPAVRIGRTALDRPVVRMARCNDAGDGVRVRPGATGARRVPCPTLAWACSSFGHQGMPTQAWDMAPKSPPVAWSPTGNIFREHALEHALAPPLSCRRPRRPGPLGLG